MDWNKVIFLAHASEDKPFVRTLYKELKENGLEPWLDEEILSSGVKWDDEIKIAIKKARFFIACFSRHSISKNGYIQKEFRLALSELERKAPNSIYFIPALIEEVELPNISVGTIEMSDYQTAKIFTKEGRQKLFDHLREQINITEEAQPIENPTFQKIKKEIANGQIETGLKMLTEYVQFRDGYMMNEIILLTSRFNSSKKQNMIGVISNEQYSLENNKLVYSILELVNVLEEKEKN